MLAAEVAVLKDLVEKELPALIQAEITRLPESMKAAAAGLETILEPTMVKLLEQLIAKIPVVG